jgi:predicted nucleic acid-binding protein
MRFWDASAIVPLLVDEPGSPDLRARFEQDAHQVVWWATAIECVSAVIRRERQGSLDRPAAQLALDHLDLLADRWHEVQPTETLRALAIRLLRTHALRAADAQQLAAALMAAEGDPSGLELLCRDARLADAASREGLRVLP